MNNKTVVITGVTGQLGSLFSDYLLKKGFKVIGTIRRLSVPNHENIEHIKNNENFKLELMDLGDPISINGIVQKYQPDYFINCAANSFVGDSWKCPVQHFQYNTLGVLNQLESIRLFSPKTRYINLGSSEEFGDVQYSPQNEKHPLRARSPYGASKIAARQIVKVYRESYNLYAVQSWCFNYESFARGKQFISRKVTCGIANIWNKLHQNKPFEAIELGNIYAKRDWSHAFDVVEGIWRMLNQEDYNDDIAYELSLEVVNKWNCLVKNIKEYVFSSNETHTVKELVELAFKTANIEGVWEGEGINEKYVLKSNPSVTLVRINPEFYRPADVELLLGDSSLVRKELGWEPQRTFKTLVQEMVAHDIALS